MKTYMRGGDFLVQELQQKWPLTQMKPTLIQVAHDLLQDEVYTREDAAKALAGVIQMVEDEERFRISAIGSKESLLCKDQK